MAFQVFQETQVYQDGQVSQVCRAHQDPRERKVSQVWMGYPDPQERRETQVCLAEAYLGALANPAPKVTKATQVSLVFPEAQVSRE